MQNTDVTSDMTALLLDDIIDEVFGELESVLTHYVDDVYDDEVHGDHHHHHCSDSSLHTMSLLSNQSLLIE